MRGLHRRDLVGAALVPVLLAGAWAAPASAAPTYAEVVYVQQNTATGTSAVLLRAVGGATATPLLPAQTSAFDATPRLSPDGSRVVLASNRQGGGLVVVQRDGTGVRALTTDTELVQDAQPTWTPDGAAVVFVRDTYQALADGNLTLASERLFRVPAAGGAAVDLGYAGSAPDVRADGRILFSSRTAVLRTGTLSGQPSQPLGAPSPLSGLTPVWSPDGSEVAYATVGAGPVLHVVAADGSGDRSLDVSEGPAPLGAFTPHWLPDGESLVYERSTEDSSSVYTTDRLGRRSGPLFAPPSGMVVRFGGQVQGPAATPVQGGTTPAGFTPVVPSRVYDSRPGQLPLGGAKARLGPGGTVTLPITTVPSDATAVVLNVTGVDPTAATFLTAYPTGAPVPVTSNVNLFAHTVVPNNVTVRLGTGRSVTVRNDQGQTDLVVDLFGSYSPTDADAAGFAPLAAPFRAYDSRTAATPLGAGDTVDVVVAGTGAVPVDATAVVLNLTGIAPSETTLLRAYPTPAGVAAVPPVSNLNLVAGENAAVQVVVAVGAGGRVRVRNDLGSADVAVDVTGFYGPTAGALFVAVDPLRLLDTRTGTGTVALPLGPGQGLDLRLDLRLDRRGLAGAVAVAATVTGVVPDAGTLLRTYPADSATLPTVSTLNLAPGAVRANGAVLVPGADGRVRVRNDLGRVGVLADVAGYWVAPS